MNTAVTDTPIPASLIAKYNTAGPRYTSYPTALKFRDDLAPEERPVTFAPAGGSISLYVHLPFCASLCRYCGCNTVITTRKGVAEIYLDALEREIALWKARLAPGLRVAQLHFGGGTPSYLTAPETDRLSAMLRAAFAFTPDAEISVELDPRRLDRERIAAFRRLGCSRASLGVQDFDPKVQKLVNRIQSFDVTRDAVAGLREAGFTSVNLDLIYGLPHQSVASIDRTIDRVLELGPDRLAVFSYAHIPWLKPAQRILENSGAMPGPELKVALFEKILRRFTAAGYAAIGLDHFAKQDDELAVAFREGRLQRNFQGYSTRPELPMLGLGVSSISQTSDAFHQNEKELPAYYAALAEGRLPVAKGLALTGEDRRRARIIRTLMCEMRLDSAELSGALGLDFETTYAPELARLAPLAADGLVELRPGLVTVTPTGRFFLRNIAMTFDQYLDPGANRHSKTL